MSKPFEDLTPEEKADVCNGCGGKGSWIKPPMAAFFKTDCDHHDYGYWKGCTEEDRWLCDQTLKVYMKRDCRALPWYKRPLYDPWCILYYMAIRLRGKKYFYYAYEKRSL